MFVEWDEPEDPQGEIEQYLITYEAMDDAEDPSEEDDDDRDIYVDGSEFLAKISHLKTGVEYEILVYARTEAGFGNE